MGHRRSRYRSALHTVRVAPAFEAPSAEQRTGQVLCTIFESLHDLLDCVECVRVVFFEAVDGGSLASQVADREGVSVTLRLDFGHELPVAKLTSSFNGWFFNRLNVVHGWPPKRAVVSLNKSKRDAKGGVLALSRCSA